MEGFDLRLFLSVDIVGSTEFKARLARARGQAPDVGGKPETYAWIGVFRTFHEEFQTFLSKPNDPEFGKRFQFWKALGDELLFFVDIDSLETLLEAVNLFEVGIRNFRDERDYQGLRLSLKGTAWLAGFPNINGKVLVGGPNEKRHDFIGPSIDAGFRVSKHSTSSHFCISVELAFVIFDCLLAESIGQPKCPFPVEMSFGGKIYFHGLESLKGVIDGRPYPIFYIEQRSPSEDLFDRMVSNNASSAERALAYLDAFINDVGSEFSLCRPYIVGSDYSVSYGRKPTNHIPDQDSESPPTSLESEELALAELEERGDALEAFNFDDISLNDGPDDS